MVPIPSIASNGSAMFKRVVKTSLASPALEICCIVNEYKYEHSTIAVNISICRNDRDYATEPTDSNRNIFNWSNVTVTSYVNNTFDKLSCLMFSRPFQQTDTRSYCCKIVLNKTKVVETIYLNLTAHDHYLPLVNGTNGDSNGWNMKKTTIYLLSSSLITIIITVTILLICRRRCNNTSQLITSDYVSTEHIEMIPQKSSIQPVNIGLEYTIVRENIVFYEQLGKTFNALIFRGSFNSNRDSNGRIVTIKSLIRNASDDVMSSMIHEVNVSIKIGHHDFLVNMVGVCISQVSRGIIHVVEEYCPIGNLLNYLISNRGTFTDECVHDDNNEDLERIITLKRIPNNSPSLSVAEQ